MGKRIKSESKKKKRLKDKVKVKSDNEKQYSITLKGYEKARAETLGIAGIKAERLGIKYAYETSTKDPKILELKSNITYYQNKIDETVLELKAFRHELEKLEKELEEVTSYEKLKEKVVKDVLPIYNEFLEKGGSDLTKDFYAVESSFYTDLDIIRMNHKLNEFDDLIKIFDEYLEELSNKTALDSSNNSKAKEEKL